MVYHKRPDKLPNPGPLLGVMRSCREAMVSACMEVKPGGTFYHGFQMVISAIDALAGLMIRRPDYFWANGTSPAGEARVEQERQERDAEAGLREWPSDDRR